MHDVYMNFKHYSMYVHVRCTVAFQLILMTSLSIIILHVQCNDIYMLYNACAYTYILCVHLDEEGDMDVRDRGMLYYRLLKQDVKEAQKVVCGQAKMVAEENTVIPRVSSWKRDEVSRMGDGGGV